MKITLPKAMIWQEDEKLFDEDTHLPLTHQVDHYNALIKDKYNLVINSSQTGGGKTVGALYPLVELNKQPMPSRGNNMKITLLISPLNTLIMQTTNDVARFIEQYKLHMMVLPITRITLNDLQQKTNVTRQNLLYQLFTGNKNYINPMLKVLNKRLREDNHDAFHIKRPTRIVFVMNPDILYGTLFDVFYKKSMNIKQGLFKNIEYMIFDEFHYYTYIQLVQFFTLMTTFKTLHKFDGDNPIFMSLLSATPNDTITDALDKIGIHYKIIEDGESNGHNHQLPFLAENTLHFVISKEKSNRFLHVIDYDFIEDRFNKGEYTFIVSNSVNNANLIRKKLIKIFGESHVGIVTGPVKDKHRTTLSQKRIVVTTSTVDIGFNFKRDPSPDRQEIDNSFVEFFTLDEFVQRVGRVGRILGKSVTNYPCTTIILVTKHELKKIKELTLSPSMNRKDIMKLFRPIFREKDFNKKFFDMYGKSMVWSYIRNLEYHANDANKNMITAEIYTTMSKIFPNDYYNEQNKVEHLHKCSWLGKKTFDTLKQTYFNSLACTFLFDSRFSICDEKYQNGLDVGKEVFYKMGLLSSIDASNDVYRNVLFKDVFPHRSTLRVVLLQLKSNFKHYLKHYHTFIHVLTNSYRGQFRGSSFQAHPLVIDENGEYTGEPEMFRYNYFHILWYYDYIIDTFTNKKGEIQEFLRLTHHLEKTRTYEFHGYYNTPYNKFMTNQIYYIPENTLDYEFEVNHMYANDQLTHEFKRLLKQPHIAYFIPKKFYWTHMYGKLQRFHYTINFPSGIEKKYCVFFDTEALIAQSIFESKK